MKNELNNEKTTQTVARPRRPMHPSEGIRLSETPGRYDCMIFCDRQPPSTANPIFSKRFFKKVP